MFKRPPKPKKSILSGLACALYVGGTPTLADETNQSLPTAMPAMAGPLTSNPKPTTLDAGPFGNVFITGAFTGFALSQSNATAGDSSALVDLTNAQVFAQKTDGDGFYSNQLSWLSGSATWKVDSANSFAVVWAANTQTSTVSATATPVLQNNSRIYDIIYTYSSGPWALSPYLQYT